MNRSTLLLPPLRWQNSPHCLQRRGPTPLNIFTKTPNKCIIHLQHWPTLNRSETIGQTREAQWRHLPVQTDLHCAINWLFQLCTNNPYVHSVHISRFGWCLFLSRWTFLYFYKQNIYNDMNNSYSDVKKWIKFITMYYSSSVTAKKWKDLLSCDYIRQAFTMLKILENKMNKHLNN